MKLMRAVSIGVFGEATMSKKTIELTTERDAVAGMVPYQPRPTIRINRQIRIKALGLYLRPRTVALALLALGVGGYALARVVLAGRR